MHWEVTEAKVIDDRTLWIRFADGTSGGVRFLPGFFRGVFSKLADPVRFAEVYVDHGAVAWPEELDLAPDAMYERIRAAGGVAEYGLEAAGEPVRPA